MEYFGGVLGALLSALFIIFVILSLGYLVGAIKVKGVSLGSAGVLLVAIIVGVIFFLCGDKAKDGSLIGCWFTIGDTTGKVNGRGVYICKCKQCIERAYKQKNFAKANGFLFFSQG